MNCELRAASPDLVGNDDLLRGVLAGCGDCIKVLDLDGRLQFMSDGGKRVMEVDDFSALKGCPWIEFWAGDGNRRPPRRWMRPRRARRRASAAPPTRRKAILGIGKCRYRQSLAPTVKFRSSFRYRKTSRRNGRRRNASAFSLKSWSTASRTLSPWCLQSRSRHFAAAPTPRALQVYTDRIMALAKAHDIAKKSNWSNTRIGDVLEAALAPHRNGKGKFTVSGPELTVDPRQALSLTLAVNELATNAIKYGSLSSPDGRVDISWSSSAGGTPTFVFLWREYGGPPVVEPDRQGFGSRVIKDFMANDFGGTVSWPLNQRAWCAG